MKYQSSPSLKSVYACSVAMAAAGVNRDLNAIKVKDTDQQQPPPSISPDNESSRAASRGNTWIHINISCFSGFLTNLPGWSSLKPVQTYMHRNNECLIAFWLTSMMVFY